MLAAALLGTALASAQALKTPEMPAAQPMQGQTTGQTSGRASGQASGQASPPASTGGFYPLSKVHRGLMATAWTVFEGTKPEPMQVEILGVLRGARGPGHDMILALLKGAKPEYTGVVAGMSGSPVYVGDQLMGSLSYRIGQFSKDPIAGITPIAQMLEVKNIPLGDGRTGAGQIDASQIDADGTGLGTAAAGDADAGGDFAAGGMTFQAMETPLVMSGFRPEAIQLWKKKMAGTGLDMVAAGGVGDSATQDAISRKAMATMEPGSAVSAQLIRGDLEISATCTVTYIDPKQLLACGHPILQSGPVSLPMTTADVVATLASPMNAFKIVNTGATIGAFTEDRDSAIRGVLGAKAEMIPVHLSIEDAQDPRPGHMRTLNFEVLDLASLTPQALMVAVYDSLLESNDSTADTSYHVTGSIRLQGREPVPVNQWAAATGGATAPLLAALEFGRQFDQIYANESRMGTVRGIDLHVEALNHNARVTLEGARLVSGDQVHAGDTVMVEATLRPWQQAARNVRIPVRIPAGLGEGTLRILVSNGGTLDRALHPPTLATRTPDLDAVLARDRQQHAADRVYVSLLTPDAQAEMGGETLSGLPLSMANVLEPMRAARDAQLNGESAVVAAEAPAGGVLSGYAILSVHVEGGGGLH
ncbi:MAG TPA: SpoIVB peptidase S55 [Terracidiphilus sp.]|nr:SpoIVB peptidase S55 [Terracidiphilus sp.]